jgi:type VI secretion system secreted protein Hcp
MKLHYFIIPLMMLAQPNTQAALNANLRLTGETQGDIKGDVTTAGREESIEVNAFNHAVVAPRDAASGLPTGNREHKPLSIVKGSDKSSPLLMQALVTNENITTLELRFWRPSRTGQGEEQYYTIKLENAAIAGIREWKPNTKDRASRSYGDMEEISWTYQKISWTYEDGGITAEDDWETPITLAPEPVDK